MSKVKLPGKHQDSLLTRQVDGEMVVYDTRSHQGFCLNESMTAIWENLDGASSSSVISDRLMQLGYEDIDVSVVDQAVIALQNCGLLADDDTGQGKQPAPDRREVVQKALGLGSMLSVPTVSVFTIPSAFAQASCVPKQGNCNSDSDCCPGCFCNQGQSKCVGDC